MFIKFKVALKRQQAAEDAIALGIRAANAPPGSSSNAYLEAGPVFPSDECTEPRQGESDGDFSCDSPENTETGKCCLYLLMHSRCDLINRYIGIFGLILRFLSL